METPGIFKTHKLWHNTTANTKIKKLIKMPHFADYFQGNESPKIKKREKKHVSFAKMFSKITQNEGKFENSLSVS